MLQIVNIYTIKYCIRNIYNLLNPYNNSNYIQ